MVIITGRVMMRAMGISLTYIVDTCIGVSSENILL